VYCHRPKKLFQSTCDHCRVGVLPSSLTPKCYFRVGAAVSHVFKIVLNQHNGYFHDIQLNTFSSFCQIGGSDQIRTYNVCKHIYGGVVGPQDGMRVLDCGPCPLWCGLALELSLQVPRPPLFWSGIASGLVLLGSSTPIPSHLCHCHICPWFGPGVFCP
jgi:hypothetical protein